MSDETHRDPASLEQRVPQRGRRPGDRYVRIVRPPEFRRGHGGTYVATEEAIAPRTGAGRAYDSVRRLLFGRPLETEVEGAERLSKKTGLGVLASDNISSSAYATEEAMRVLALAGVSALVLTMPIALAIAVVLAVVVLSQTQVIRTYPGGGGSYAVAKGELGSIAGLVVASALLVDYVLTVAVSIAAPEVRAVHVATSEASAAAFRRRWDRWAGKRVGGDREILLDVIESPFRALLQPLLRYIDRVSERDVRPVTVVLAEYVPRRWWEFLLHSQTAFRIKAALLFRPNTVVIDVPYHYRSDVDALPRASATIGNGAKLPRVEGGPIA